MDEESRSQSLDQIRNAPTESEANLPDEFTITFHRAHDIGGWWVESSIPGAMSQGHSLEEAAVMGREAVKLISEEDE